MKNIKFLVVLLCVLVMGCVYSQFPSYPVSKEVKKSFYSSVSIYDSEGRGVIGSGVIIKYDKGEKTKVLTAFHVVDSHLKYGELVPVKFAFSEEIRFMKIIRFHRKWDLALLKCTTIEKFRGIHVDLADEDPLVGDKVVVVGNPLGNERNVSMGVLSKIINAGKYGVRYRTDTDVIYGNSGGGIFDNNNDLIGIVTNINILNLGTSYDPDVIIVPGSGLGTGLESIKEFLM